MNVQINFLSSLPHQQTLARVPCQPRFITKAPAQIFTTRILMKIKLIHCNLNRRVQPYLSYLHNFEIQTVVSVKSF